MTARFGTTRRIVTVLMSLMALAACSGDDADEPRASTSSELTTPSITSTTVMPSPGFKPQPDGVSWPTEKWPIGKPDPAVDIAAVDALVDEALHAVDGEWGNIEAVLVVDGGQIVYEDYGRGFGAEQVHESYSIAKTVTHAATGILSGDGLVDVESPVAIDEWAGPDDPRGEITTDMLLSMTSGLEWNEFADSVDEGPTAASAQIDKPLVADVDTKWNYSTGSTAVVGQVLGDIVGTGEAFEEWMQKRLFAPIGIDSVELAYDKAGYFVAGTGADMTARDYARFGLLYLRDGVWDGARILPEGWVDYGRTPAGPTDTYGAGLWTEYYSPNGYSAEGRFGQNIIMVPDADLVVVVLSDNPDRTLTDDFSLQLIELFQAGVA